MYKKKLWRDAYNLSDAEYCELCKQPTAQMVVKAVIQYNDMVSLSSHSEQKNVNELLIKEAEEEDAKAFLDGVFDIVQKRE